MRSSLLDEYATHYSAETRRSHVGISMDAMKDRVGLKSTISWGHGESKGTGRSLIPDEPDKPHEQKISGIGHRTTVSAVELYQTSGGSFNLGQCRKP